jgi:hypothetical protein
MSGLALESAKCCRCIDLLLGMALLWRLVNLKIGKSLLIACCSYMTSQAIGSRSETLNRGHRQLVCGQDYSRNTI